MLQANQRIIEFLFLLRIYTRKSRHQKKSPVKKKKSQIATLATESAIPAVDYIDW
jgi:hypothetical protein